MLRASFWALDSLLWLYIFTSLGEIKKERAKSRGRKKHFFTYEYNFLVDNHILSAPWCLVISFHDFLFAFLCSPHWLWLSRELITTLSFTTFASSLGRKYYLYAIHQKKSSFAHGKEEKREIIKNGKLLSTLFSTSGFWLQSTSVRSLARHCRRRLRVIKAQHRRRKAGCRKMNNKIINSIHNLLPFTPASLMLLHVVNCSPFPAPFLQCWAQHITHFMEIQLLKVLKMLSCHINF